MSKANSELKDSKNETDANTQSELDLFMIKHLKKKWPKRGVRICGILQIIFSLAIAGLEVPIMMNSAPRWETFGGFWTGLIGFIAAITTLVTAQKSTWTKLKVNLVFCILAGLAALLLCNFDLIFIVNRNVCIKVGTCSYSDSSYSQARIYYIVQFVITFLLLISTLVMIYFFFRFGMDGVDEFEDSDKSQQNNNPVPLPAGAFGPMGPPMGPPPPFGPMGQGPPPPFGPMGQGPMGHGPPPPFGPMGQGPPPPFGPMGQGPPPPFGPMGQGPPPPFGPMGQGPPPPFGPSFGAEPWGSSSFQRPMPMQHSYL